MNAVDTNILVRFFVKNPYDEEDKIQKLIARKILQQPSFISLTVILETAWVLKGHYKFSHEEIAEVMTLLCDITHIDIENQIFLKKSITHFRNGMDFADALHLSQANHCEQLYTFDKKFIAKSAKLQSSTPVLAPIVKT